MQLCVTTLTLPGSPVESFKAEGDFLAALLTALHEVSSFYLSKEDALSEQLQVTAIYFFNVSQVMSCEAFGHQLHLHLWLSFPGNRDTSTRFLFFITTTRESQPLCH